MSVNSGVVELCGSGSPGSEEATAAASLAAAGVDVLFFFRHGRSCANEGCFTHKCRARLDVEPPEYEYSFPQVSHLALFVLPATWEKCIQMELRFERSVLSAILTFFSLCKTFYTTTYNRPIHTLIQIFSATQY